MSSKMSQVSLADGTQVFCIHKREALVLDEHCEGYLDHGITVDPGDVVFDIGANIGLFGLRMNQRTDGNIQIFAFEPIPAIHAVAAANLAPFDGSVVLRAGVSSEPGEMRFTYYPNTPSLSTAHPGMWQDGDSELTQAVLGNAHNGPMWYGRLLPRFLASYIAKRLRKGAMEVQCQLMTVSEVIAEHKLVQIDLLKVDCEGAELDVLRGVSGEDWPKIKQAVLEVHDVEGHLDEVKDLLSRNGLTEMVVEQEPAFINTSLWNVFARRP